MGIAALYTNSTATNNTAIGAIRVCTIILQDTSNSKGYLSARYNNTSGITNTAMGTYSLYKNTDWHPNTANGN